MRRAMTYLELYEEAERKLKRNEFTIGEFDKMIEPLRRTIDTDFKSSCETQKQPMQGKWLEYDNCENFTAKCSICGNYIDTRHGTNYCPNCGSRNKR